MEAIQKTNWKVDPVHSEIGFKVKHMMISTVSGNFNEFEASVETDDVNFENSDFIFSAKTESINTKNKDRDKHLRSEDFFHADKYPEISFKSKSFDGKTMVGDLTIKNITKEISLDITFNGTVVDQYHQSRAGFEGLGAISRKDFDLSWNAVTEAGNVIVSDKVSLVLDVQFIKQQ